MYTFPVLPFVYENLDILSHEGWRKYLLYSQETMTLSMNENAKNNPTNT